MKHAHTSTVKQVNENQCQSCMPLGGVVAFKGIETRWYWYTGRRDAAPTCGL